MSEERYAEIARRYTPAFIKVRYKRRKNGKLILKPAHACLQREEMLVPRPITLEALAYYLHECAHFHLRHFDPEEARTKTLREMYVGGATETVAQQEYEAETWTIATLRREGIAVPAHILEDMRKYVKQCIRENGGKIPGRVKKFIK